MKANFKLASILLALMIAGSSVLSAQGGKGSTVDTTMLKQMQMRMHHDRDMYQKPDSAMMRGMGSGHMMGMGNNQMGPGQMMPCMCPCMRMMGGAMNRGFRHQQTFMEPGEGGNPAPGQPEMGFNHHRMDRMMIMDIPNLTVKQKKDIEDLRQKQQTEMQKMRDENQKKMESMRESHRNAIMNLLTPEQKKWMEENMPVSK